MPTSPDGDPLTVTITAVPRGMRVLPVGLFNSREALGYLMERLSGNPSQRLGAIDLVRAMGKPRFITAWPEESYTLFASGRPGRAVVRLCPGGPPSRA